MAEAPAMISPFITFADGRYVIDESTAAWLSERETPFAVATCAGKFRTGKSFLLNRLVGAAPGKGFGVGETVQACTRGIWLSRQFLAPSDAGGGVDTLVMDSEGIDALDADNEHDVRIFALAVLACSVFVYNSLSHLDEAAVQTLSLMTHVAESVGSDGHHAPALFWVLRDFALSLADPSGKPLTPEAYLEDALHPPATAAAKCGTRDAICKVFPERHLIPLPRPHRTETAQRLEHKGSSAITPKFERAVDDLRTRLVCAAKPVSAGGVPLTGRVYVAYVRAMLAKVNADGAIPRIEDSWSLIRRTQHADVERRLRTHLLSRLDSCPVDTEPRVCQWMAEEPGVPSILEAHMHPPPSASDLTEMLGRVHADVMRACKAAGRVRDIRALVEDAAARAWQAYKAGGYNEEGFLEAAAEWHGSDSGELFLACLAKHAFLARQDLVDHGVRIGEVRANADVALAQRNTELEIAHLREKLADKEVEVEQERHRLEEFAATSARVAEERALADQATGGTVSTGSISDAAHERGEVDKRGDLESEVVTLRSQVEDCTLRLARAEDAVAAGRAREEGAREAFHKNMAALERDGVAAVDAAKAERDGVKAERDMMKVERDTAVQQRAAISEECQETRVLAREAQERAVDVHRTTLDELRRRDAEARTLSDKQRTEWVDMNVRMETSMHETRGMKRRFDEMVQTVEEVARLRSTLHTNELDRMRDETELRTLRTQLSSVREEGDTLRRTISQLESHMAVLEATSKYETCRRALGCDADKSVE